MRRSFSASEAVGDAAVGLRPPLLRVAEDLSLAEERQAGGDGLAELQHPAVKLAAIRLPDVGRDRATEALAAEEEDEGKAQYRSEENVFEVAVKPLATHPVPSFPRRAGRGGSPPAFAVQ